MQPLLAILLVSGAIGVYVWLMLRKLGVGQPGGKPDCGCGTCHTKRNIRP